MSSSPIQQPRFAIAAAGLLAAAAAVGVVWPGARDAQAQAGGIGGSGAQIDIEMAELRLAAETARAQSEKLGREILRLEEQNANLGEALAAANAESQQFRDSYSELRGQMEALGLTALDPGAKELQDRLLQAVSDLRLAEEKSRDLSDQIVSVNDAVVRYLATAVSPDPEARASLEASMREASATIGISGRARPVEDGAQALGDIQVVGVKADLDLLVLNVGRAAGIRPGTPFRIVRRDRQIATALAVDIRDQICGAVVQGLATEGDPPQLGDTAQVDAVKPL